MMKKNEEPLTVAWDARERFTNEIVWRIHVFLNQDNSELKRKLDALSDLFMLVIGYCDKQKDIRTKIKAIQALLYPIKGTTSSEADKMRQTASDKITDLYFEIYTEIKDRGFLTPEETTRDPNRAFAGYWPKE